MKVALSGSHGFIGRAVSEGFTARGADVVPIDRSLLTAPELIADFVDHAAPDAIFHLAGILRGGGAGFLEMYQSNFLATLHVLQGVKSSRLKGVPVFLAGSAAQYGRISGQDLPVRESSPQIPFDHYGMSKFFVNQVSERENREGMNVSVLRLFNIIGPGMSSSMVPRCFLERMKSGETKLTTRPLNQLRDFLDIDAVPEILWKLLGNRESWGKDVNICSGTGHSVLELVSCLIRALGSNASVHQALPGDGTEYDCVGDASLLARLIGYRPSFDLEKSIRRFVS